MSQLRFHTMQQAAMKVIATFFIALFASSINPTDTDEGNCNSLQNCISAFNQSPEQQWR